MKTLDEIKELVAIESSYNDWQEYINDQPNWMVETIMDKVAKRYAIEVANQLRIDIAEKLPTEINKDIVLNTEIKA